MADDTLTLALHGDVSLDAFAEAVARWRGLVESITRETSPDSDLTWMISDLASGSATVTARAIGSNEDIAPVTRAYLAVGRALATGHADDLPRAVRDDAVGLATIIKLHGEVEYIRFETAEADTIITTNWDALLERAIASTVPAVELPAAHGGVQGRIQTLTSRNGLRFTLYDTLFDRAVGCYLTEGQEEIMRDVWGQTAVVEGVVTRDPLTGRPLTIRRVVNVTGVREVPPDAYLLARGVIARRPDDAREPEALISAARDV